MGHDRAMRNWRGALFMVLAFLPGLAFAQIYRWVDERGTVHYTDGLDGVPERYRSRAQPLPFPKSPPTPSAKEPSAPQHGITKISFTPGSPILVSAKINGGGPVTLVLDTGATRTMVAPLVLWRLGISTRNALRGEIKGVTGTSQAEAVRVDSVEVGEAKAGPLLIIAHDADIKDADGLLGRDFLEKFKVTIDSTEGLVTLAPR